MTTASRLVPVSYYNPTQEMRLSAFADTIVYEQDGNAKILRAIRMGGYPEMVKALSDAIYGGATIDVELNAQTLRLQGVSKQFQRQVSHDGIYAEATLLAIDDDEDGSPTSDEDDGQDETDSPPRKCIIFCPMGDRDHLFAEIDRKTSVPLIPAFKDYLLHEMQQRGDLKQLAVYSLRERLEAWVLKCKKDDANLISIVEDGLRSGAISVPGTVADPTGFDGVENVTGYLNTFGITVAQRIRNQFQPLFDPATEPLSPEILAINDYIRCHAGYPLYGAQLAVAESVKRKLQADKCAFIVAECGSGKTKIGSTAMAAVSGLRANQSKRNKDKTFNLILAPSHVTKKWTREIAETLPETAGVVIHSITELDKLYAQFQRGDKSIYAVISKEKARDGYMKMPAAIWNKRKSAFLCPDCMGTLEMPFSEDGVRYMVKADSIWYRKETKKNRECPYCGSRLWTACNPSVTSEWVKLGSYGWVHRRNVYEHLRNTKDKDVVGKLQELYQEPDGYYPPVGACRRYPLSSYIKRKYKHRLDGAIVDELHQYNNNSGQGDAMGEIFQAANKVIGMTATLINGYSSGIFYLLYRTVAGLMRKDNKPYHAPEWFNAEYGVVEHTYEEVNADYSANRRTQKRKTRSRQLPGVSPLVYSRFLLEHAAFLSLSDMGKDLPDYEEIPIPLQMSKEVALAYGKIQEVLRKTLKMDKKIANKILSAYLNLLTIYPDQPYDQPEILHPMTAEPIVTPPNIGSFDTLGAKEQATLDIVKGKIEAGEKVLIYTSWVRTDSQQKLVKGLTEQGYRTEIMTEKVTPNKREEWVQKKISQGMQVMITNPSLVETGLDLNAFTTLIFYSMGYNLFTLRQASRRSWRINQMAPRVEVYLLYYQDTMQHKAMKLMASKLAVAGIIEGNFTEEGLSAMSDVQDMTSQMAKELMAGIRDNVEDIATSFKKMAIINPDRHKPSIELSPTQEVVEDLTSIPARLPETRAITPERQAIHEEIMAKEQQKKSKARKKQATDENQMSLFSQVA